MRGTAPCARLLSPRSNLTHTGPVPLTSKARVSSLVGASRTRAGMLAVSCVERTGPDAYVTIPQGFRGLIQIIEDPKNGTKIDLEAPVYDVPSKGTLQVTTLKPLHRGWTILILFVVGCGQ